MMTIQIEEYIDVQGRAKDLGLDEQDGLVFLPRNFDTAETSDEFFYESSLQDLQRLFNEADVQSRTIGPHDRKAKVIQENAYDWVLPTLYVSGAAITLYQAKPELAKIIIDKLREHSKTVFAAVTKPTKIKWNIVVEDKKEKKTHKFSFEGPAEELVKVQDFLHETFAETALSGKKERRT